jgi:predicted phage tail protein
LVNEKNINPPRDIEEVEDIRNSELMMSYESLETIDIIPSISGSDKNILGIVLIVAAVALIATGVGAAAGSITLGFGLTSGTLIVAGLGLAAAGAMILLSKPPKFEPFGDIESSQRDSYLLGGPVNTVSEGGPVPLGYGELIVGSNVVAQNLQVRDYILRDDNDFNKTDSGIIIVDKASQYDWAISYLASDEYQSDLAWYDEFLRVPYWMVHPDNYRKQQYHNLYFSKYFIYWYQVQQQMSSFLASDSPAQYSATLQG